MLHEAFIRLGQLKVVDVNIEMRILREWIRLDWCYPTDQHKLQETRHNKRVTGVRAQLLSLGYVADVITQVLQTDAIPAVAVPNMLDDADDLKFAKQQVDKNVRCGALISWPFRGTRPHVVLSLAVVRNIVGKPKLIVDIRPLNLHMRR